MNETMLTAGIVLAALLAGYLAARALRAWLDEQLAAPAGIGTTGPAPTAISDKEWEAFLAGHRSS